MDILENFYVKHPKAKIVFKGFAYLFSERIIRFVVGFFVHALVARYLGPVQFGELSFVMKTVGVFATFSLFGVDEIVLSHLMKAKYEKRDVFKTVFILRFISAVVGFLSLVVFVFTSQEKGDASNYLTVFYGLQIFLLMFSLFDIDFQSRLSFRPLFWANNISSLTASALRVVGVYAKFSVSFFLTTYLIGDVLLRSIIQFKLGFKVFQGKFNSVLAKDISKASAPFFIANFLVLLDQRVSYFYIEKHLQSVQLGNYSIAVTLVDLWLFLPLAVCSAVFPTIVKAFHDNETAYRERKQFLADIMVWFGLLFALGIFVAADWVIHILYGDRYIDAPTVLRLYALSTIPIFFNLARTKWMALEESLNDWLIMCVLTLILNIFGHHLLVNRYGVKGAILSFLISQLIANILCSFFITSARQSFLTFLKTAGAPFRIFNYLRD